MWQAQVRVDLDAIRHNVASLCAKNDAQVMAVVKADGYGHGMLPVARAALAAGARWLGVCTLEEALELRAAGISAPILAWLLAPGLPLHHGVAADIDLSAASRQVLRELVHAAGTAGRTARVHLKVDTGLGRGGATLDDWPALVDAAAKAQADGAIEVVGLWSHFACADVPGHPSIDGQLRAFREAVEAAERVGLRPPLRHLANSAGMLTQRVPAGQGVSYGHAYRTGTPATLAVVPLGYGDGIPRAAGNRGPMALAGRVRTIAGRVCMDQVVLDCGDDEVSAGDVAVLIGPGAGEPTADDWAVACDTINYEIVTRMGSTRVPRVYLGEGGD